MVGRSTQRGLPVREPLPPCRCGPRLRARVLLRGLMPAEAARTSAHLACSRPAATRLPTARTQGGAADRRGPGFDRSKPRRMLCLPPSQERFGVGALARIGGARVVARDGEHEPEGQRAVAARNMIRQRRPLFAQGLRGCRRALHLERTVRRSAGRTRSVRIAGGFARNACVAHEQRGSERPRSKVRTEVCEQVDDHHELRREGTTGMSARLKAVASTTWRPAARAVRSTAIACVPAFFRVRRQGRRARLRRSRWVQPLSFGPTADSRRGLDFGPRHRGFSPRFARGDSRAALNLRHGDPRRPHSSRPTVATGGGSALHDAALCPFHARAAIALPRTRGMKPAPRGRIEIGR